MQCRSSGSGEDGGGGETPMEYSPSAFLIREVQRGYELMGKLQALLDQDTCTEAQIVLVRALLEEAAEACNASLSNLMSKDGIKVEAQSVSTAICHDPVSCNFDATERDHETSVHQDSWQVVTNTPYHDGHEWRKYGEKKISGFLFPRCYYRCTYKEEHGCPARKQVQQQNYDDPPLFMVTYRKEHTCNIRSPDSNGILLHANNVPPSQPFFLQFDSKDYVNLSMGSFPGISTNICSPLSLQANSTCLMTVKSMDMANQALVLGGMLHNNESFCGQCPSSQQLLAFDAGYMMVEQSGYYELDDIYGITL